MAADSIDIDSTLSCNDSIQFDSIQFNSIQSPLALTKISIGLQSLRNDQGQITKAVTTNGQYIRMVENHPAHFTVSLFHPWLLHSYVLSHDGLHQLHLPLIDNRGPAQYDS